MVKKIGTKKTVAVTAVIVVVILMALFIIRWTVGTKNEAKNGTEVTYVESTSTERFGAEYYFEITGSVSQTKPPEPYCNTNEDGSLRLFLSYRGGTPYRIEGPIYDHDMFEMKTYVKTVPGKANMEGGGTVTDKYEFTPKKAGETKIVTLQYYSVNSVYQGTVYSITVEDDLRCRMNWYGGVTEGENLEIGVKSDEN